VGEPVEGAITLGRAPPLTSGVMPAPSGLFTDVGSDPTLDVA